MASDRPVNPGSRAPWDGPLGQASAVAYWMLVVGLLVVLTTAPGLVPLVLLERDASNVPLVALCLVPVAPAFSAAVFALNRRERTGDLDPARAFWRGYRLNVLDVLRLWVPALAVLALLATNVLLSGAAGVPAGFAGVALGLAVVVLVWTVHAVVVASVFSFRTRDVARLAASFLVRTPLVSLGVLSLLVLAAGIVYLTSDWVLGLLGSVFALLVLRNARPMLREIEAGFTA